MERRNLFKLAGVGAAGSLLAAPWRRLTDSIERGLPPDDTTVRLLEDRTADFFRAEEFVPAKDLLASIEAHRETVSTLAKRANSDALRTRLLRVAGESDALCAWLYYDLGLHGEAVGLLRSAIATAREAGDNALIACALTYWSYLASTRGDVKASVRLLGDAQEHVRGRSSAATRSWIAAREAEETAKLPDRERTELAVERAVTAFDYASPQTERVWTPFFTSSRLGSMTVSAYSRIRHPDTDAVAADLLTSLSPGENKVRAIVLADLAIESASRRDFDRADELAGISLGLAERTEASIAFDRLRELRGSLPDTGVAGQLRDRLETIARPPQR